MREIRREGDRRFGEPYGPLSPAGYHRNAERMRDRSILRPRRINRARREPLCRASVSRQFPIPLLARRTRDKEIAEVNEKKVFCEAELSYRVFASFPRDKISAPQGIRKIVRLSLASLLSRIDIPKSSCRSSIRNPEFVFIIIISLRFASQMSTRYCDFPDDT